MFRNYLTVALRNLFRQKLYSSVNILGLAVGMACCTLILLFVRDEWRYDRYHPHSERIYRVTRSGKTARTPFPLADVVRGDFPEVRQVVRFSFLWQRTVGHGNKRFKEEAFVYADPNVFEVFAFPLAKGNPQRALEKPLSIVITQEMARKYFGEGDPLGKVLRVENRHDYTVTGVLEDIPENSHFRFDFMATLVGCEQVFWKGMLEQWGAENFFTYLLVAEGTDAGGLGKRITDVIAPHVRKHSSDLSAPELQLQRLLDIHLFSGDFGWDIAPQGNIAHVGIFSAIAVFVLLLGCINFVNLATARSLRRAWEVGLRKVVGASRRQLIGQFLGEAFLLSGIAFLLALALVELALPGFNAFTGKSLALFSSGNRAVLVALLGIGLFTGLLSGSYPAFYLSGFRPAAVLKDRLASGRRGLLLRRALVVFQFCIAIALVIGTAVIYGQLRFLRSSDLGFRSDHVLVVDTPYSPSDRERNEAFGSRLMQSPNVVSVTRANLVPSDDLGVSSTFQVEGGDQKVWLRCVQVWYGYFRTFGIDVVAGRSFSPDMATDEETGIMLNESAVRALGLEQPLETRIRSGLRGNMCRVVGVVRDVHFESLYNRIRPMAFQMHTSSAWKMAVRIRPENVPETLAFVREKWTQAAPEEVFDYRFVDESFDRRYRSEEKAVQAVGVFTALAVCVACLGLFGLVAYTVDSRTREIGIRKVLGASAPNIVLLLSKEFIILVALANVVAWPVAYFAMQRWLQRFAYQVDLGIWTFVVSGALALAVALATVSAQAVRAALANPVDAMRYE